MLGVLGGGAFRGHLPRLLWCPYLHRGGGKRGVSHEGRGRGPVSSGGPGKRGRWQDVHCHS